MANTEGEVRSAEGEVRASSRRLLRGVGIQEQVGGMSVLTPALSSEERATTSTGLDNSDGLRALSVSLGFTARRAEGKKVPVTPKRGDCFSLSWGRGPG